MEKRETKIPLTVPATTLNKDFMRVPLTKDAKLADCFWKCWG